MRWSAAARFEIRVGGQIDFGDLANLFRAVGWESRLEGLPDAIRNSALVIHAHSTAGLIGFARVISDKVLSAWLLDVCVHPLFQRHGVGGALVESAARALPGVDWLVTWDATPQATFFERHGFQRAGNALWRKGSKA